MNAVQDVVSDLHIEGRERKGSCLRHLQTLLLLVCSSDWKDDVEFSTPACWKTFESRRTALAIERAEQEVVEHVLNIEALGQIQRSVTLCTADPLPALLRVLHKYKDKAYLGRGENSTVCDTRKPWTFRVWKDISAHVPPDGVPLMIRVYSDACNAKGKSYHPIIMELAHFCESEVHGLDLMVTTTLFQEPKIRSGIVLNGRQKAVKLQVLNLAVDASFAWLHNAMRNGVQVYLDDSDTPLRLYPRIIAYDGDQPELVSLIGKTCYMCWSHSEQFDNPNTCCSEDYAPLTAQLIRNLRELALNRGRKTDVQTIGMRHPEVNFRCWSTAHAPLIESRIGGIPRLVRADDLHINVLGTVKKIYDDLFEYLDKDGIAIVENGFAAVKLSAASCATLQLQSLGSGVWNVPNVGGNILRSFIWQLPEVLLRERLQLLELGHPHRELAKIFQAVVLAREVLVVTHCQRRFGADQARQLRTLISQLRSGLMTAFKSVRDQWNFPKFHTMSAFVSQIQDRGIGSTYRGEAKHRYLKEHAAYTPRRQDNALSLLRQILKHEARARGKNAKQPSKSAKLQSPVCLCSGSVARALTEHCVLEYVQLYCNLRDGQTDLTALATDLYNLLAVDDDSTQTLVDACNLGDSMVRAGQFVVAAFAGAARVLVRVVLMVRSGESTVRLLLQTYEDVGRCQVQCTLLRAQPLGIVSIEPTFSFVVQPLAAVRCAAHVFAISADDEVDGSEILVRDLAYEQTLARKSST